MVHDSPGITTFVLGCTSSHAGIACPPAASGSRSNE